MVLHSYAMTLYLILNDYQRHGYNEGMQLGVCHKDSDVGAEPGWK